MDMNACYKSAPEKGSIDMRIPRARLNAGSFIMRRIFGLFPDCEGSIPGYVTWMARNENANYNYMIKKDQVDKEYAFSPLQEKSKYGVTLKLLGQLWYFQDCYHLCLPHVQNYTLLALGCTRELSQLKQVLVIFLGYGLASSRWIWILYSVMMVEYQGNRFLLINWQCRNSRKDFQLLACRFFLTWKTYYRQ